MIPHTVTIICWLQICQYRRTGVEWETESIRQVGGWGGPAVGERGKRKQACGRGLVSCSGDLHLFCCPLWEIQQGLGCQS